MINWLVVVPVLIAAVFYGVIPGLGAVYVRSRWRRFRMDVRESLLFPPLRYGGVKTRNRYRFSGRLEAVQGDTLIWLEAEGVSVGISLSDVPIYLIPSASGAHPGFPDETPRVVYWDEISAMAQGTHFYVAGTVEENPAGPVFRGTDVHDPLVVVYDGPDHSFLKRTIWTGRQRNEYWNHLTLFALTGGFLAQLVYAVVVIRDSRLAALLATVLSMVPILPLIPPGVVGYFFYRRVWRAARRRRAIRDVLRIGGQMESARSVGGWAWAQEIFAVGLLLLGIWFNGYLIALILALTVFAP